MPVKANQVSLRSGIERHLRIFWAGPLLPVRLVVLVLTAYLWWIAVRDWKFLFNEAYGNASLGYDLNFSWLAAKAFAHGGAPFSVAGFVYPPSHVLLVWPLAAVSFATIKHVGLYVMVISMCATVMVSAELVGRRFWGLTAAIGVLLLRFTQPVGDEIVLENISALMALALAVTLLLAARKHWLAAGAVLGLALSLKPILAPIMIVILLAKQWRALGIAIGIPVVLNAIAFVTIKGIGEFWSVLPFLFDRTGVAYDAYNSALASVGSITGLPTGVIIALRLSAVVLTIAGTWLSWTKINELAMRLVITSGVLLGGVYVFGTLTEDHYMLTLIPLLVSVGGRGSPMRWPFVWLGGAWIMSYHSLSPAFLGVSGLDAQAVSRCIGLGLLLVTICIAMLSNPFVIKHKDRFVSSQYNLARRRSGSRT